MQQALDQYQPNSLNLVLTQPSPADLSRSDTRSFGETHASELLRIVTADTSRPAASTPPPQTTPDASAGHTHHPVVVSKSRPTPIAAAAKPSSSSGLASSPPVGSQSPPLDPSKLNQTPAMIPIPNEDKGKAPALAPPVAPETSGTVPPILPTVAETGVPKSAGPEGPGPATGSLLNIRSNDKSPKVPESSPTPPSTLAASPAVQDQPPKNPPGYGGAPQKYESAEDEKKRLQREERDHVLTGDTQGAGAPPPPHEDSTPKYESAEAEKKRLEAQEREKLLQGGGASGPGPHDDNNPPPPDSDLPPYEEY